MFSFFRKSPIPRQADEKLTLLLKQQGELFQVLQLQQQNLHVLYRRTTVLAHMLDALAKQGDVAVPRTIRAEIDASLRPEEFAELAKEDEAEFIRRYGMQTLEIMKKHGLSAISTVGDLGSAVPPTHTVQ